MFVEVRILGDGAPGGLDARAGRLTGVTHHFRMAVEGEERSGVVDLEGAKDEAVRLWADAVTHDAESIRPLLQSRDASREYAGGLLAGGAEIDETLPVRVWFLFAAMLLASGCTTGDDDEASDAGVSADTGLPEKDAGAEDASPGDAEPRDSTSGDGGPIGDAATGDASGMDAGMDDTGARDGGKDLDGGNPDGGGFYTLTVATTSTGGAVVSTPGNIDCTLPATGLCSDTFSAGTQVTLTASAAPGFAFDRWSGDCAGSPDVVTVTMDMDRSCTASFIGTAGQVSLVPPPVSVVPNVTEDPTNILIFREREDFLLPAGIPLDIHVPDRYTDVPGPSGAFPAGLAVNVYFVHFDPVGLATVNRAATLFFPEPIIGMIVLSESLDDSDAALGLTSTVTYPNPGTHGDRGLELTGQDEITLRGDRRHVDFDFITSTSSDQFRIITLATPGAGVPFLHNGAFALISPPASVTLGQLESSTVAYGFFESSAVLGSGVTIDVSQPGIYNAAGDVTTSSIGAGTPVISHLIHYDPVSGSHSVEASVTFERDILGLIIENGTLGATDGTLGHPGVTYLPPDPNRRVELGGGDWIRFGGDLRSFRAQLAATNGSDQIRVVLSD